MQLSVLCLVALLPALASAVPTTPRGLARRENWGKDEHKDWKEEHKEWKGESKDWKGEHKDWKEDHTEWKDHEEWGDDDWKEVYHAAGDKDWKPYFRPSPAPKYVIPEWKYDQDHEYADAQQWFNDRHVENYPAYWTSAAVAYATPDTIINNNGTAVPGLQGGYGTFAFGLNSAQDVICYNITVYITGEYSSPAKTATHIHQAAVGAAGPPRLAFPNPEPKPWAEGDKSHWEDEGSELELRYSYGCLKGPFTTGILANETDTASGFTIATLEADPAGFFADTHTAEFTAGAIRGQLRVVKPTWDYKEPKEEKAKDRA